MTYYKQIKFIIDQYELKTLNAPLTIYFPTFLTTLELTTMLISNHRSLSILKKALAMRLTLELNKHKQHQIIKFSQNRCEDFSTDTS